MLLLTTSEFRSHIKKYLQLSIKETIGLKCDGVIFEIKPSQEIRVNPSPSNDSWFDNPQNMDELDEAISQLKSIKDGKLKGISLTQLKESLAL